MSTAELHDQNETSGQNENEILNEPVNEPAILVNNVCSSQPNEIFTQGIYLSS